MFVEPSTDINALFDGVHVPFNTELLIIHMEHDSNSTMDMIGLPIKISEVYRVDSTSPLRVSLINIISYFILNIVPS